MPDTSASYTLWVLAVYTLAARHVPAKDREPRSGRTTGQEEKMARITGGVFAASTVCGLLILTVTAAGGQGGAAAASGDKGAVVGTGVFTVFVENMDRSLAFYHHFFVTLFEACDGCAPRTLAAAR
jgi:hypothetical protein